ncbi:MAG: thiol-disulfide oxidoreductase DCC family protein [Phycisphaerales bacterium]
MSERFIPEFEPASPGAYTLLYDRECPFCRWEVHWLSGRRAAAGQLDIVDIAAPDFDPAAWGLGAEEAEAQLHGVEADGRLTVGMHSVRRSYEAAGLGWLVGWTAWPVLRIFADFGYRIFARYRVPLGRLFGRSCEDGVCEMPAAQRRAAPAASGGNDAAA